MAGLRKEDPADLRALLEALDRVSRNLDEIGFNHKERLQSCTGGPPGHPGALEWLGMHVRDSGQHIASKLETLNETLARIADALEAK